MTRAEFVRMKEIIECISHGKNKNEIVNVLYPLFKDRFDEMAKEAGERGPWGTALEEKEEGFFEDIINDSEDAKNLMIGEKFSFETFIDSVAEKIDDINFNTSNNGKFLKVAFKAVDQFGTDSYDLENVKTKVNSKEYMDLIGKFNGLTCENGLMYKAFSAPDGIYAGQNILKNQFDDIIDLAEKYMKHKAKDGIKENAFPKMDKVIKIYEYTKKKGEELGFYKDKEKVKMEFECDEDTPADIKRNKFLARFSPNEKTSRKWLDKNEKITEKARIDKDLSKEKNIN